MFKCDLLLFFSIISCGLQSNKYGKLRIYVPRPCKAGIPFAKDTNSAAIKLKFYQQSLNLYSTVLDFGTACTYFNKFVEETTKPWRIIFCELKQLPKPYKLWRAKILSLHMRNLTIDRPHPFPNLPYLKERNTEEERFAAMQQRASLLKTAFLLSRLSSASASARACNAEQAR